MHILAKFIIQLAFFWAASTEADTLHNAYNTVQRPLLSKDVLNVAIIGAGSAGSSAAYYLRHYANEKSQSINITIFERSNYVGGRSTTVDAYDDPSQPVELGASIFVSANRNLVDAVKAFNLSSSDNRRQLNDNIKDKLGVWDGARFVFTQPMGSAGRFNYWWNIARLWWRYGLDPIRALRLKDTIINQFLHLYEEPYFPFQNLTASLYDLELTNVTGETAIQFLSGNGIKGLFTDELIQASTRVNYAQNLDELHGVEAMVCLAADGAMSVSGGNWKIFERMTQAADANVMLGREVFEIVIKNPGYNIRSRPTASQSGGNEYSEHELLAGDEQFFDVAVIASPFYQSNIAVFPKLARKPIDVPFVKLHVTLFSSPHLLSPVFFNMSADSQAPTTVLTTLPQTKSKGNEKDSRAGPMKFWSISTLYETQNPYSGRQEFIYKIFSPNRIEAQFLAALLGFEVENLGFLDRLEDDKGHNIAGNRDISWFYRKQWQSYPYLKPTTLFDNITLLDEAESGLYYTGGMERFISTMETSSLMGMNVAKLISNQIFDKVR